MSAPIIANYISDGKDWKVTVTSGTETRQTTAPGLLAARDRVNQLTSQIKPEHDTTIVLHLLDGDAYAFTTKYLEAQLGISAAKPEATGPTGTKPELPDATPTAESKHAGKDGEQETEATA
ncbi:MAG TPA: hypothetical protein VGN81_36010 [Pseudonocardiaceae bacterium]|jgi:hypothetical protein